MTPLIKEDTQELTCKGRGRPRDEVARGRILAAALAVLEELGYANATSDAIAERAGASKATIYRWWPNKSAVLLEALREAVSRELPFPDTGNLRDDVRLQLQNFCKLLSGRRGRVFRSFVTAAQHDPEVSEAFRSIWVRPRRETGKAALERHRGKSLKDDVDLELVMDCLYAPFYYRLMVSQAPLSEKFIDGLTDLVLAGIAKRQNGQKA